MRSTTRIQVGGHSQGNYSFLAEFLLIFLSLEEEKRYPLLSN